MLVRKGTRRLHGFTSLFVSRPIPQSVRWSDLYSLYGAVPLSTRYAETGEYGGADEIMESTIQRECDVVITTSEAAVLVAQPGTGKSALTAALRLMSPATLVVETDEVSAAIDPTYFPKRKWANEKDAFEMGEKLLSAVLVEAHFHYLSSAGAGVRGGFIVLTNRHDLANRFVPRSQSKLVLQFARATAEETVKAVNGRGATPLDPEVVNRWHSGFINNVWRKPVNPDKTGIDGVCLMGPTENLSSVILPLGPMLTTAVSDLLYVDDMSPVEHDEVVSFETFITGATPSYTIQPLHLTCFKHDPTFQWASTHLGEQDVLTLRNLILEAQLSLAYLRYYALVATFEQIVRDAESKGSSFVPVPVWRYNTSKEKPEDGIVYARNFVDAMTEQRDGKLLVKLTAWHRLMHDYSGHLILRVNAEGKLAEETRRHIGIVSKIANEISALAAKAAMASRR